MELSSIGAPRIGTLPSGAHDLISDVVGVRVGHCTIAEGDIQSGVSILLPHADNLFMHKVPAAVQVINGFGKSAGLMQVAELGTIESPIALTNTFAVGTVSTALIRQAIAENPELARSLPSVNPLVFECNDGRVNDAHALAVREAHVVAALQVARQEATQHTFAQGAVGAGRGMRCFGLKGGIGSASRELYWQGQSYTVGVLVLANQGRLDQFILAGRRIGEQLTTRLAKHQQNRVLHRPDQGSIIIVLATDAPLDYRQLRRVAKRSAVGLARTGSDYGHGSGDVALAFSTAYRIPQLATDAMPTVQLLHETSLDLFFQASAEATEQAILHALFSAETVCGRSSEWCYALRDIAPDWANL